MNHETGALPSVIVKIGKQLMASAEGMQ